MSCHSFTIAIIQNREGCLVNKVLGKTQQQKEHHLLSDAFISHYNMHKTVRIAHVFAQPLQGGLQGNLDPVDSDCGLYKE